MSVVISQSTILAPDWTLLDGFTDDCAADALASLLSALDRVERQAFAARGQALIVIEDRKLWVGRAESMGQWIKQLAPNSFSDCYAAMRSVKQLAPDIPLTELEQMPRCNVETIKKLSSSVRRDPKVIAAAKEKSRTEFIASVAETHPDQHLSVKSRMAEALEMCQAIENCSRKEAEEFIAEFYIAENAVEYERLEGRTV